MDKVTENTRIYYKVDFNFKSLFNKYIGKLFFSNSTILFTSLCTILFTRLSEIVYQFFLQVFTMLFTRHPSIYP